MLFRVRMICIAIGVFIVSNLHSSHAQERDLDKQILGEWNVTSRVIAGKSDTDMVGGKLVLTEAERTEITLAGGATKEVKLIRKVHDEKNKVFRFTIETTEDNEAMGGGGPRKGICRINEKGELEIVETRSASHDFPPDFSDATKAKSMYWKLTKKIEPK